MEVTKLPQFEILYSQLAIICVFVATILYTRFIYFLGKYWEYLVEHERELLTTVYILNFISIFLIIMAYLAEMSEVPNVQIHFFKVSGTVLFLLAGLGLNTAMEHYRQNLFDLDQKYVSFLNKSSPNASSDDNNDLVNLMNEKNPKIISVIIKGYVYKPEVIKTLSNNSGHSLVYILGPTHPGKLIDKGPTVWLSSVPSRSDDFVSITPTNLTGIVSFFSTAVKKNEKTLFIGDFIETVFENESSNSVFNFLNIVNGIIMSNKCKLVILISDAIADEKQRSMCKNISDWIIEVTNPDSEDSESDSLYSLFDLRESKKYAFIGNRLLSKEK